mmetsp:Transcript_22413/g.37080  ORF Transcript_22413/g.37080 Transcript_22413/m.37080 type:complete len:89 (-) Transcript_22413:295-561(-)
MQRHNSLVSLSQLDSDESVSSVISYEPASPPPSRRTSRHNPVVTAMLKSNTMRDCHQVTAMFRQCQNEDSNSAICSTAKSYFARCSQK